MTALMGQVFDEENFRGLFGDRHIEKSRSVHRNGRKRVKLITAKYDNSPGDRQETCRQSRRNAAQYFECLVHHAGVIAGGLQVVGNIPSVVIPKKTVRATGHSFGTIRFACR